MRRRRSRRTVQPATVALITMTATSLAWVAAISVAIAVGIHSQEWATAWAVVRALGSVVAALFERMSGSIIAAGLLLWGLFAVVLRGLRHGTAVGGGVRHA